MRESDGDTPVPIALSLTNKTTNIITDKALATHLDFLDVLNSQTFRQFINTIINNFNL